MGTLQTAFAKMKMAVGDVVAGRVAELLRSARRNERSVARRYIRAVNRTTRHASWPRTGGKREVARRLRQIASGQLTAANGLHVAATALQSATYPVKSNAARAAKRIGLDRSSLFEVAGGWAFNVQAVATT